MKKYLLTVIGNLDFEMTKIIGSSLELIVDSPHLKFFQTDNATLFHFASEVEKNELFDYLLITLDGLVETYILSEYDDKLSVQIPIEAKGHLFDLESDGNSGVKFVYKDAPQPNSIEEECEDEDFVALLLEDVKKRVKKPTLDQILEKISKSGFNSLSQYEKDTLEFYSKNQ